jgi:hypothetical protein
MRSVKIDLDVRHLRHRKAGENAEKCDAKDRNESFFHGFEPLLTRSEMRQTNLGVHHADEPSRAGLSHAIHGKESGEAVQGGI